MDDPISATAAGWCKDTGARIHVVGDSESGRPGSNPEWKLIYYKIIFIFGT